MDKIFFVFIGGGFGAISRYLLSNFTTTLLGNKFPFGTFVVNVIGCFLVGVVLVISDGKFVLNPAYRLSIIIGFLGAFTTFSAFVVETDQLMESSQWLYAFGNIVGNVVVGLIFFRLGIMLGKAF